MIAEKEKASRNSSGPSAAEAGALSAAPVPGPQIEGHEVERLMELSEEGFYRIDPDGLFTYINREGALLLGYSSPEDVVGRVRLPDLAVEGQALASLKKRLSDGRAVRNYPISLRLSDGKTIHLEVSGTSVDGRAVIGTFRDVTSKQAAQRQLREGKDRLKRAAEDRAREIEESSRSNHKLLVDMAHDIRTSLNSIIGFSEVILSEIDGPLTDMQRKDLRLIFESGEALLKLVGDILDTSRIWSGRVELSKEWFELQELLSQSIAEQKGYKVKVVLETSGDPSFVYADRPKVKDAFLSLLRGVLELTDHMAVLVKVAAEGDEISVSIAEAGGEVEGGGAHSLDQPHASFLDRAEGGTLSMAVSKRLIKAHGGRVWAESHPGVGSALHFTLPITGMPSPLLPKPMSSEGTSDERRDGRDGDKKILYIEDNIPNRALVRRALGSAGYRVVEADDGMSGIEVASRESPDLILMDINLPDMDGYEVATKIKGTPWLSHIPIVALTAYADEGDRERAITAGCDGYIAKPIDVGTFPALVSEFLSGKHEAVGGDDERHYLREHSRKLVNRLEGKIKELTQANDKLRELNRLLSDKNKELVLADRERKNMVDIIGHEFKSPLSTIKGYLQLMGKGAVKSEEQSRVINVMVERVNSLNNMVSDIINLTISDRSHLNIKRDNLSGLLGGVYDEFSRFGNIRNHTIKLDMPAEAVYCDFDRDKMYKVYANLVGNAIKFTPDGGTITIGLKTLGEDVVTYVEDSGIGIDPSYKDWIWKPFKSTDSSLRHHTAQGYEFQGGGLGIGLTLVKHIAELHGGSVRVESEGAGKGSKFTIVLRKKIEPLPEQEV
jgi:PAS domain S-box-containing protein